jgi:uncharacterized membrane protein YkvA (DUF1232 family)
MMWRILLSVGVALLAAWAALVVLLLLARPKGVNPREALRLMADILRLLYRLAADPSSPRGVKIRIWLALAYLAIPIDLVPDFLPIIGYADDAIIVCIVLRSVVRLAGADRIRRHWPGSDNGLVLVLRIAGLPAGFSSRDLPTAGHCP